MEEIKNIKSAACRCSLPRCQETMNLIDTIEALQQENDNNLEPDIKSYKLTIDMRDELIEQIKMRYGSWIDAYIIGGYPEKYERERLAQSLGAELIYCESTKEECLRRLYESNKPDNWKQYIESWWDKYGG
jgi:hypothetical protein